MDKAERVRKAPLCREREDGMQKRGGGGWRVSQGRGPGTLSGTWVVGECVGAAPLQWMKTKAEGTLEVGAASRRAQRCYDRRRRLFWFECLFGQRGSLLVWS